MIPVMMHFRTPNCVGFFTKLMSVIRSVSVTESFCSSCFLRIYSVGFAFLLLLFFYIQTWGSEGYHLWVIDGNSSSNMKPERNVNNEACQFGILQFHFIKSALTVNPCMVSFLLINISLFQTTFPVFRRPLS